ncbi:MAG: acyl carrier protein [Candidatus Egerieousia sp.]
MANIDVYKNCFIEGLELNIEGVENATMESVESWDSIGQMSLIALIEDAFGVELEPDEIMEFTSYESGIDILKKHNIEL